MFCITLALKDNPVIWTLLFESEAAASTQFDLLGNADTARLVLKDDFGQTVLVDPACIAGSVFENLSQSMLAHIERGLHNARTQAKAQQIAANDPVLKTAAMARGQGPAIFSPQGNGAFHG